MTFTAGQKVRASQLNEQGVIVARARRIVNTAGSAAAFGILRLDDIPILAGRAYELQATGGIFPNAANLHCDMFLRHTTDGSTPGVASPALMQESMELNRNGFVYGYKIRYIHVPPADQTLSLLITAIQTVGGSIAAYAAANWPTEITIIDLGGDPGDTGVDI